MQSLSVSTHSLPAVPHRWAGIRQPVSRASLRHLKLQAGFPSPGPIPGLYLLLPPGSISCHLASLLFVWHSTASATLNPAGHQLLGTSHCSALHTRETSPCPPGLESPSAGERAGRAHPGARWGHVRVHPDAGLMCPSCSTFPVPGTSQELSAQSQSVLGTCSPHTPPLWLPTGAHSFPPKSGASRTKALLPVVTHS